jgi:hypothetical protein
MADRPFGLAEVMVKTLPHFCGGFRMILLFRPP